MTIGSGIYGERGSNFHPFPLISSTFAVVLNTLWHGDCVPRSYYCRERVVLYFVDVTVTRERVRGQCRRLSSTQSGLGVRVGQHTLLSI